MLVKRPVSTRVIISPYFLFWLIRQLSKQSRVCSGIRPWLGEMLCVRVITMHCFASSNISGYLHRSWPTLVSLCFQYLDQVISRKINAAVLQAVGSVCCEANEFDKCHNQKWLFWQNYSAIQLSRFMKSLSTRKDKQRMVLCIKPASCSPMLREAEMCVI